MKNSTKSKSKWHPPPPPTPRILHLPRPTTRRKHHHPTTTTTVVKPPNPNPTLGTLFNQESAGSLAALPVPVVVLRNWDKLIRRRRAREEGGGGGDVEERVCENDSEEMKLRFEAEMLRGECKVLRVERDVAVKMLERERGVFELGFKSALNALLSSKKKIRGDESDYSVLEEEIEGLTKKLEELQRNSKVKDPNKLKHCSNFDKQASLLQKQLEQLGKITDENSVKDIYEISGARFRTELSRVGRYDEFGSDRRSNRFADVETLRRKMEGLSKGKLLKRMEEEYGSMFCVSANCFVPSSASTSRRYDLPDFASLSVPQSSQSQEAKSGELKACSGHCKAIVRRIMEQVRAETEQWSQMQEMLGQVRGELEELRACRDFWEERALQSDYKVQTLSSEVEEWKEKALSLERKDNQLKKQVQELQQELEKLRFEKNCDPEVKESRDLLPISLGAQLAKEKQLLTCVKGNNLPSENRNKDVACSDGKKVSLKNGSRLVSSSRHPFKDVGNLSSLKRQNSRRYVYPLHNPQDG